MIWMRITISFLLAAFLIQGNFETKACAEDHLNPEIARGINELTFQGINPQTGALQWEGDRSGELPGHLVIEAMITGETVNSIRFQATWTFTSEKGSMRGNNIGIVNTATLHIEEHGEVTETSIDLNDYEGSFLLLQGYLSDLDFIPGETHMTAIATLMQFKQIRKVLQ